MAHNFFRFLSRLRPLCLAAGCLIIALPCFSQAKPDCSALPDSNPAAQRSPVDRQARERKERRIGKPGMGRRGEP